VHVVRHSMEVAEYIRLFQRASVVVGIHGAGFQNMMFMPRGGLLVHIGAFNNTRSVNFYGAWASTFDIQYRGLMSDDPTFTHHGAVNITVNTAPIIHAISTYFDSFNHISSSSS